jgi:uncharacterized damage-inducible protein DinB
MPATDRTSLIDAYDRGADLPTQALRGLTADELLRHPPADAGPEVGKWSIHQVIVHLADAEFALADRVKRIIAEDDPVLLAWDENRFAARLAYDKQSAQDAAALISLTRKQLARVLRTLPAEAFDRTGRHSERGPQTAADVLTVAVSHMERHLGFVRAKRKLLGKPD